MNEIFTIAANSQMVRKMRPEWLFEYIETLQCHRLKCKHLSTKLKQLKIYNYIILTDFRSNLTSFVHFKSQLCSV